MHWTFLILVAWIFGLYIVQGQGASGAVTGVALVLALFVCVVLHELGHALTARRFGVATRDIVLLPIGGVARLERMPDEPLQELAVAVAGPIVSIAIAAVLAGVLLAVGGPAALVVPQAGISFVQNLCWANVFLVVFNLIPAFPMDGGRMLRAVLATQTSYSRATHIAAALGQLLAIGFAFAGLFWIHNPFLLFIALFVYFGAAGEARMADVKTLLRNVPVRDAMITKFTAFSPHAPLQAAIDELLAAWQTDFPIVENGTYRGMLRRSDIGPALEQHGANIPVGELMDTTCPRVGENDLLEPIMETMEQGNCSALPVLRDGQLVGLLTKENLAELMMVRGAARGANRTVARGRIAPAG